MQLQFGAIVAFSLALCAGAAAAQDILPRPDPGFAGTLDRTLQGSKPEFLAPLRQPAGAPNVLVVLIDDAGFGYPATFGGPVATPTLDGLTVPLRFSGSAGMDVGRDNGLPVSPNWIYYLRRPFPFEGTIERVTFDLK